MSRNKYPEETERLVLDTAERLFLEKGYDNTTIQDIVDRLGGLTKGALYHHFKSKEDLFLGVVHRIFGAPPVANADGAAPSGRSAEEKLGAFFGEILGDEAETRMRNICPDLKKTPRFLPELLNTSVSEISAGRIADIAAKGAEKGEISTRFPREFGEALMILINFWISPYVFPTDRAGLVRKLRFADEFLGKFGISPISEILSADSYEKLLALTDPKNARFSERDSES